MGKFCALCLKTQDLCNFFDERTKKALKNLFNVSVESLISLWKTRNLKVGCREISSGLFRSSLKDLHFQIERDYLLVCMPCRKQLKNFEKFSKMVKYNLITLSSVDIKPMELGEVPIEVKIEQLPPPPTPSPPPSPTPPPVVCEPKPFYSSVRLTRAKEAINDLIQKAQNQLVHKKRKRAKTPNSDPTTKQCPHCNR